MILQPRSELSVLKIIEHKNYGMNNCALCIATCYSHFAFIILIKIPWTEFNDRCFVYKLNWILMGVSWEIWGKFNRTRMLQMELLLFAVVALMAVRSTVAIVGGLDAVRGRFPYFALIKSYQLKAPVIFKETLNECLLFCTNMYLHLLFAVQIALVRWRTDCEWMGSDKCSMFG